MNDMTTPAVNPETERPSETLYRELAASRNSGRRDNAKHVKAVCDQMEKDGVEINIAEVARRCVEYYGGPAKSTIGNTGSGLGEYVKLRINEQKVPAKKSGSQQLLLSSTVADPTLAAQIQILEDKISTLARENLAFRNLFKQQNVNIDAQIKLAVQGQVQSLLGDKTDALPAVDNALQGILLKLMDHLFKERSYTSYKGRFAVNMKPVLNPIEYDVYRRASGLSDEQWEQRYGDLGKPKETPNEQS